MNMWINILFLGATAFSMVDCRCWYFKSRTDYEPLCSKWWNQVFEERSYKVIGNCVTLIEDKCPHLINVERSKITRTYYSGEPEEWKKVVKAVFKTSNLFNGIRYDATDNFPVCWDDNGQVTDCDYWWLVAKYERAENKYKERCIKRISLHCPSMIEKVSETNVGSVQRWLKTYDVITVTYKRTGVKEKDTASFNLYVRGLSHLFDGVQYKQI